MGLGLALAAVLPLAFYDGVIAAFTLPKLMLLSFAVLAGAVGVLLGALAGKPVARRTPLDLAFAAAAIALAASYFASQDRHLSLYGMYNYYAYGVWPMSLCAAVYFLAVWLDRDSAARRVLDLCLAVGALAGIYAAAQVLGLEPFPGGASVLTGSRAVSTMGSPVSLGVVLAMLVPMALHQMSERRSRALGCLGFAALAAGLFSSGSRGAWVGAAVGASCYFFWTDRLNALRRDRRFALAAVLAAMMVVGLLSLRYAQRATPAKSARVEIWKTAWKVFRESPWLGAGPDSFELGFRRLRTVDAVRRSGGLMEYQAHAHNDVLEALATTGLVGTAAYIFLLFSLATAAAKCLSDPARRPVAAALCAGLLALFVNMKFNPVPMEALTLAALFAGLLLRPAEGEGRRAAGWTGAALASALAVVSAASAMKAVRLMAADRRVKMAHAQIATGRPERSLRGFQAALQLNPCEIEYHMGYVNFLSRQSAAVSNVGVQRQLLQMAAESGERAVVCRPRLSLAHYTLGVAALMQARVGLGERLALAEREFDAALALDPLLASLMQVRLEASLLRGDLAAAEAMRGRLRALGAAP